MNEVQRIHQYPPITCHWPHFRMRCPRCGQMVRLRRQWTRPIRAVAPSYTFQHCGLSRCYSLDQLEDEA